MTTATETEPLTVDEAGRVSLTLPVEFAGARVTVERVSPTELRIRVAAAVAEEAPPAEADDDRLKPLSDRDRDMILDLFENPPEPSPALIEALRLHRERHG